MDTQVGEESIRAAIAECHAAMGAVDADRMLACLADDGEIVSPDGRFVGQAQVGGYLRWLYSRLASNAVRLDGAGVQVFGNMALEEIVESAVTRDGTHLEIPVLIVNQFDDDAKLTRRAFYTDRWPVIQALVSTSRGFAGVLGRSFASRINQSFNEGRPTPS